MSCSECAKQGYQNDKEKRERIKQVASSEAKKQGFTMYALLKTVNPMPGYMWRPVDHPDCVRLGVEEYCTVD